MIPIGHQHISNQPHLEENQERRFCSQLIYGAMSALIATQGNEMVFRDDLLCSVVLLALVLAYASGAGNTLYLGYWYLTLAPVVMWLPGLILRARPLFLTGTTGAAVVTLLVYMAIVSSSGREGGLVGLGHFFSAPGMLVGTSVSAWLLRSRVNARLPWIVAGIAFLGAGCGFLITQVIVCTTAMYCGALSMGVWN